MSDRLTVERVGGFGGFGLPGSHLKSSGEFALSELSADDRAAVKALFDNGTTPGKRHPDAFVYRITRQTPTGPHTVEMTEDKVPESVRARVVDRLD